jgi:site-specific DNA-methyltransferase (adenine-specific)
MIEKAVDGRCKYCGASQLEYDRESALESHAYALTHVEKSEDLIIEVFGDNVKFDVVIGNPPYQAPVKSVCASHTLWDKFAVLSLEMSKGYVCLVHPSGWRTA